MTIRSLECCCCGNGAGRWQQHWNRDTGYGVCASCVDWQKGRGTSDAEIADLYGKEGVNWGRGNIERKDKRMTATLHEYGLMIDRTNNYGTDYVEVHVVRREPGRDIPLGCSSDGERFYGGDTPKHLCGLRLDGLGMWGFVTDDKEPAFIAHDVEYRNVHSMDEAKLRGMAKTIKRVNDRINKDFAREPGDRFMAFAAAFKLSFAVHRIGPRSHNPEWRWMTITEGRNYYRDQIEVAITEKTNLKKGVA